MTQLITAVSIVLVSSAFFSGSEAALFSVPIVRVRQLAESGQAAALALLKIRQNMSRPIATIVILNNIANIVGSIIVGSVATRTLGSESLGVVSGILTFLVIIFSEIIPKTLGERYAERIGLIVARPVLGLAFLFTPLVWVIERLTSPITRGARLPTTNEAEIRLLAHIGSQEGIIESDESEMIQRIFRLNDLSANDILTPRVNLTYLESDSTLEEVKQDILESQHSRIIVIGESIDDVRGIAYKNELLAAMVSGKYDQPVVALAHEAHFVPESIRADRLLELIQQTRKHLMVVLDEFGGTAGVVTLEDVLEVITGEIVDETDTVINLRHRIRRRWRRPT